MVKTPDGRPYINKLPIDVKIERKRIKDITESTLAKFRTNVLNGVRKIGIFSSTEDEYYQLSAQVKGYPD